MKFCRISFLLIILFCACAPSKFVWRETGPEFGATQKNIEVFFEERDIEGNIAYNGFITAPKIPLEKFIKRSQKIAAEKGSDGIVIVEKESELRAYSFKYIDLLTAGDWQLIRNYNAQNMFRD